MVPAAEEPADANPDDQKPAAAKRPKLDRLVDKWILGEFKNPARQDTL